MPDFDRVRLLWNRLHQKLWWRPASWSAGAVAVAFASSLADSWVPPDWLPSVANDVVEDLLRLMASSMLVVSTFSLSVLASAYASAASGATPRARRLVVAEPQSQKAVAVFLAAFIFSVVGLVALGVGDYGPAGHLVLFMSALAVLAWVVVSFMTYIDVLSRIGQISHTIGTVERAAWKALCDHASHPLAGAREASTAPENATPVFASQMGHVQFVDVSKLQTVAERHAVRIHVAARAGDLVHPNAPLLWVQSDDAGSGLGSKSDLADDVREAFVIGSERTIEQDAAYGLIVLAEIAQRALSPAVNDPGTAIAVLGSQTRLLVKTMATEKDPNAPMHLRVSAAPAPISALVPIAYEPIARLGIDNVEVMHQLIRHLDALAQNAPAEVAQEALAVVMRALERAARLHADPEDLARWQKSAEQLHATVARITG